MARTLAAALVLAGVVGVAGCGSGDDDEAETGDDPTGSAPGVLTEITDPPGATGPVVGTNLVGEDVMVIDAATFCGGYEQFQEFRTGYLALLGSATGAGEVEAWVETEAASGEEGATAMDRGLSVNAGDVGMLPWTFVVNAEERLFQDRSVAEMLDLAEADSEALAVFDDAAAGVC
jgi:hypothetical protein